MKVKDKEWEKIEELFPKQRGNVKIENRLVFDALIYRCKNGCSGRELPVEFGYRHAIHMRLNRWAKNGVSERIYEAPSDTALNILLEETKICALDSTSVKVHPNAQGALKKTAHKQ
jgi:transposase